MRRCSVCQVDYPDALEFCPSDGIKLPPLPGDTKALYDPLIGSTIDGRYLVDAVLGEGGMGIVYAARHAIIDKRVAIKVLRKEAAADESAAQRFLAEAKAASKIDQQNIVDITDFGVLPDGHAYFVMEFLDGVTLSSMVHKGGPLVPGAAVSIAIQVARGLSAAHDRGIIHRDLKPENIFVIDRDGIPDFVKIVDFGIARDSSSKKRLTVAGMVMGTPEYMAPEQASGQDTDHRVDQYALGCILYESVTGLVPFAGENAMQTLTKHVFEPVTPPSMRRPDLTLPPPLESVILKALSKKREDRYPDMDAFMRALQEIQPSLRGIAVPLGARGPFALPDDPRLTVDDVGGLEISRNRRGPLIAFAGGTVALAGVLTIALWPSGAPPKPVEAPRPIAAPPPAAASVEITLDSQPPGAEVFLGAERIGLTPTSSKQTKGDTPLHFVFRLAGYKEAARDVTGSSDGHVEVQLVKDDKLDRPKPEAKPDAKNTSKTDTKRPFVLPTPGSTEKMSDTAPPKKTAPVDSAPAAPRHPELRNPFAEPGK